MTNERVALEQSVAELHGKAIALARWLNDNEAKLPSGVKMPRGAAVHCDVERCLSQNSLQHLQQAACKVMGVCQIFPEMGSESIE